MCCRPQHEVLLYNRTKENRMFITSQEFVSTWKHEPRDEEILEKLLSLDLDGAKGEL